MNVMHGVSSVYIRKEETFDIYGWRVRNRCCAKVFGCFFKIVGTFENEQLVLSTEIKIA